jgi:hypothetical protein
MIVRVLILAVSMLLHILTPRWVLNDFLAISDWIMISFLLMSPIIYRFLGGDKNVNSLSLLLSINCLLYFIMTVKVSASEIYDERAVYRLMVVLNKSIDMPLKFSKVIETINALQIVLSIVILILAGLKYLRKRFITH